jgi:hypothetical protein
MSETRKRLSESEMIWRFPILLLSIGCHRRARSGDPSSSSQDDGCAGHQGIYARLRRAMPAHDEEISDLQFQDRLGRRPTLRFKSTENALGVYPKLDATMTRAFSINGGAKSGSR